MILSSKKLIYFGLFLAFQKSISQPFQKGSVATQTDKSNFLSKILLPKSTASDFVLTAQVLQNANCNQKGTIISQAQGGIAPYQYQIVKAIPSGTTSIPAPPPAATGIWSSSDTFSVDEGSYIVFARDNTGLETLMNLTVPKDSAPNIQLGLTNFCVAEGNFELTIGSTPGKSPYFVSSNGGTFQQVNLPYSFSNLKSGIYTITIKDSNGCESSQTTTIYEPLKVTTNAITPSSCGSENGIVSLKTIGGSTFFEYQIIGELPIAYSEFTNLSPGNYTFRANDKITGCSDELKVQIPSTSNDSKLELEYSDVSCNGGNNGSISAFISNSKANTIDSSLYEYSIDKINFQKSTIFSNLKAGEYTLQAIIKNSPECTLTQSITISEPISMVANLMINTPLNCGELPQLELEVAGGIPPYSYSKDGKEYTTTVFYANQKIEATIGKNAIYARDANGCVSKSNEIVIESYEVVLVEVDESLAKIKCNGDSTAKITATAVGGIGSYRFCLTDETGIVIQPFQSSGVFSNLSAGKYKIKIESNNCASGESKLIIIDDVKPLILNLKECNLNEIIAMPSGGVGNYKFTFEGEYTDDIPSYTYYTTQDYSVTVQDANGCKTTTTQKFNHIEVATPKYFTPNGDGINDFWSPENTDNYTNLIFSVFDRNGRDLGTYRFGQSWDGKYQGVELPSGDYWYLLKLNNSKDDREYLGHFTLYR